MQGYHIATSCTGRAYIAPGLVSVVEYPGCSHTTRSAPTWIMDKTELAPEVNPRSSRTVHGQRRGSSILDIRGQNLCRVRWDTQGGGRGETFHANYFKRNSLEHYPDQRGNGLERCVCACLASMNDRLAALCNAAAVASRRIRNCARTVEG